MIGQNNLNALSDRIGINAMVNYFNGELGNDINDIVIKDFYNNYLLDSIELAASNYIFQNYAKPYYVPAGHENKKLKRYGSLTEHTTPLPEGLPPKSDKTRVESFTATYNAYGRFMEFTDAVSYKAIDPIIAIYTEKYGKLAAKTKERLARNEMLHSTSILVPQSAGANGAELEHMTLEDRLTFNDYRVQVARMKRMLVEPVDGSTFHLIGSPEVKFDLITDELVRDFYGKDSGIKAYQTDELPVLFNIAFKETMLDDYAYGYELANPGEIDTANGKALRIYTALNSTGTGTTIRTEYYINVPKTYRKVKEARLSDGSYIPEKVTWDLDTASTGFLANIGATTKMDLVVYTTTTATGVTTVQKFYDYDGTTNSTVITTSIINSLKAAQWKQLPLHRTILLGKDALIETGIEGHTDAKMYIKPLGSAGVLDPLEQRQSIGFKIDSIGYSLLKPEACVVCYTIPSMAVDTNDLMYNYGTNGAGGNISMNRSQYANSSYGIPGNRYTQLQTEEGYNSYGKVNAWTGNVDTNRFNVPEGQLPYFKGSDEFGPAAKPGVVDSTTNTARATDQSNNRIEIGPKNDDGTPDA